MITPFRMFDGCPIEAVEKSTNDLNEFRLASQSKKSARHNCACCGLVINEFDTWHTSDGRIWCADHWALALELEEQARMSGRDSFEMPGPHTVAARSRVVRNNRLRHLVSVHA